MLQMFDETFSVICGSEKICRKEGGNEFGHGGVVSYGPSTEYEGKKRWQGNVGSGDGLRSMLLLQEVFRCFEEISRVEG